MNVAHFILMLICAAIVGWLYAAWYFKESKVKGTGL